MFYIAHFAGNYYLVEDYRENKIVRDVLTMEYGFFAIPVGQVITKDHNLVTYSEPEETADGVLMQLMMDNL